MLIDERIRVRGGIEGEVDLVVRGRVDGPVRVTGTVTVEQSGAILSDITARDVFVAGMVKGNIEASERIEIARTGRVAGDARAPEIAIAPGATFRGRLTMGDPAALEVTEVTSPALATEASQERRALPRESHADTQRRLPSTPPARSAVERSVPALARPRSGLLRRR